jgi:hypothetical protein
MSKLSFVAILSSLLFISVSSARAQDNAAPSNTTVRSGSASSTPLARAGYREHDGFYVRMLVGGGVGGSKYRDGLAIDGGQTRTLGANSMTEVAVGWAVFENLIVHATLNLGSIHDGAKKVGKRNYHDVDETTIVGFAGGGLTYYLMPANVYVTGSVGLGGLGAVSDDGDDHHESKVGLGTSFAIGKEWWIGGQWGLGVALTGAYYQGSLELDGANSTYRGFTSGAALSATFN